jgi:hypothetical protein
MIIQPPGIFTLKQYQEAAGKIYETKPSECFRCLAVGTLHGHGYYQRGVTEGDVSIQVKIHRLLCVACGKTFSSLFPFLVPWKKYTVEAIADGVERYLREPKAGSRRVAELLMSLIDGAPSLSQSTVTRWVKAFCEKSKMKLLTQVKRLCVSGDINLSTLAAVEQRSQGWLKATFAEAAGQFSYGRNVIALGMLLTGRRHGVLKSLHEIFLRQFSPQSIFAGQGVTLLNPQSLEHLIF